MEKKINRQQLLKECLQMAQHNLCCYSGNLMNTKPKDGMEAKWEKANAEYRLLQQMLDEFPSYSHTDEYGNAVYYRKYVCTIGGWASKRNLEGVDIITHLEIDIDTPHNEYRDRETRVLFADMPSSTYILNEYDRKRHERYDAGVSASIIVYVDTINYIRKVEWVVGDEDVKKALEQYE